MRPRRNTPESRSWLWSRWFMGAVVLVFLMLSGSLLKELLRSRQINTEIDQLKDEIALLQTANQEGAQFVEYLKTDLYLEEQARIKLGLKAPGEKTIVLQDQEEETVRDAADSVFGIGRERFPSDRANALNWIEYFWGNRA